MADQTLVNHDQTAEDVVTADKMSDSPPSILDQANETDDEQPGQSEDNPYFKRW